MQLSNVQRKQLREVLLRRLPTHSDAREFFDDELDQQLEHISGPSGLRTMLYEAIKNANAQGWAGELVDAALTRWRDENDLARLRDQICPRLPLGTVWGEVGTFDMREHVRAIRWTRSKEVARGAKIVIAAVPEVDEAHLRKLFERVADDLRVVARSHSLRLDDVLNSPASLADEVLLVEATLAYRPVAVAIRVAAGSIGSVKAFCSNLRSQSPKWANELIVILAVEMSEIEALPSEISRLPPPVIAAEDLGEWIDSLVANYADWPVGQTATIAEIIHERVHRAPTGQRWGLLYSELESWVMRLEPANYATTIQRLESEGAA